MFFVILLKSREKKDAVWKLRPCACSCPVRVLAFLSYSYFMLYSVK